MQHKHDRTPEQIERVARLAEAEPGEMRVVKTQIIGGRDDLPSPHALDIEQQQSFTQAEADAWSELIGLAAEGDPGEGDEELRLMRDEAFRQGIRLLETAGVLQDIRDALDVASEDYAYRADFEERHGADEDDEERSEYEEAADKYGALETRIAQALKS